MTQVRLRTMREVPGFLLLLLAGLMCVSGLLGAMTPATAWASTTYSETERVPQPSQVRPRAFGPASAALPSIEASVTPDSALHPVQLAGKTDLRETQRRDLELLAIQMENNSLRYLHTTWWQSTYQYQRAVTTVSTSPTSTPATATVEVLVPPGGFSSGEIPIRRQSSALYATAMALSDGSYNAGRVGVSNAEALRRTVAWTNALAISYQQDGWARGWQSSLWVYQLGMGAKLVWSSLPTSTQVLVRQAVTSEANFHLTLPPIYYRDATGTIIAPGYSKGPEDSWNANLLYLAARQFPDDSNAGRWEGQARWYSLAAYATPSQVGLDPRIGGSNVNADGTIINHRIIHPDYMLGEGAAIAQHELVAATTGTAVAPEALNNRWAVWRGLTNLWFPVSRFPRPGGTMYRVDSGGHAIADMYYPQGTDWSYTRRFNAAETDIVNFVDNLDAKAYSWARKHTLYTIAQQARHSDGRIFSAGETQFAEEEQFAAASAAESAQLLILARYGVWPPGYHTRVVMTRDSQLWNSTIGTKRNPSPKRGGKVSVTGPIITVRGLKYIPIAWGGNHAGWVRYDYTRWL